MRITDQELRDIQRRARRVLSNGTTSGAARALANDALYLTLYLQARRKPAAKKRAADREVARLNKLFFDS